MILNLEDQTAQDRFVPDVIGYNFSVLMPDPYSSKAVRKASTLVPRSRGLAGCGLGDVVMEDLTTGQSATSGSAALSTVAQPAPFRVGDQWRITIYGASPNHLIYLNARFRGMRLPFSGEQDLALSAWLGRFTLGLGDDAVIGKTDASGNWVGTGTFTSAQAGNWFFQLNLGDMLMYLSFSVADESGQVPADTPDVKPGGSAYYLQASNQAPARQYTAAELTAMSQVPGTHPKPNQSVPPTTPITTIPTLPSGVSTRQMLTSAYAPSGAGGAAGGGSGQLIPGVDNTKLLVGAGLLVAVLMAVKK